MGTVTNILIFIAVILGFTFCTDHPLVDQDIWLFLGTDSCNSYNCFDSNCIWI